MMNIPRAPFWRHGKSANGLSLVNTDPATAPAR
ncbi:hypothetical protein SALBM311S_07202 [Streptomyces alboniger]